MRLYCWLICWPDCAFCWDLVEPAVLAENILLKQQLLILRRSRRRAPNLRPVDRVLLGFCSQFLSPRRLIRTAVILKPATLLRFHRGFKDFKYRFLYSSSPNKKPGPK